MADLQKVIKGLECCAEDVNELGDCLSNDCPYKHNISCCSKLACDALALLKAKRARVLTLEEMPECVQIPCWLEWRDGDSYYAIIHADGVKVDYARLFFICAFFKSEYGVTVRCWNTKPTDAEREAVAWDD